MTPRLETVEEIFHSALDCSPDELSAFLDERCAGDEVLRGKVEELLAAHRRAEDFIETPLATLTTSKFENVETDLLIGQRIGHYKISRRISAGGMGAVYLAERADRQYEKQVAIKLIKRGMDTDSVLRHFRNERQILASFDHPNIARLLDGGATESGLPYFVMEYVEGLPVDAYCDGHALSIVERLKLFREVCAAVSYAHRHTVIHRDIKPSNILVTSDGTPKLLDFGIAKILQPADAVESLATLTGLRLMTPEYASPEQVRGQPLATVTDVYSLGVVLYQLLTGRKPYRLKTRTPEEISRAILEQEPPRPSTAVAKRNRSSKSQIPNPKLLRGDLDNIVLMALRKEPERRYQSAEQFSDDIRRHLESRPVRARRDTIGYRARKFVQRNKLATAAAVLILISLIAGLIATSWQKARAERRFNDVRQLARSVLFDYHDAIKNLPGATSARERLVKDALNYLDSLATEAAGDPSLQHELAAAYEKVGDVRGEVYGASLGDMAGAVDSYEKALRIREALVSANPRDVNNRRDLAYGYMKIGTQLQDTGQAARGLEYLRKACRLCRQLSDKQPDNSEVRDYLARAHNELGIALQNWGDPAGALQNHQEALRLRKDLLAADPNNVLYRRHLAITYWDISRALLLSGNTDAALQANQNARDLCTRLLAENPDNIKDRSRLGVVYQNDGECRALAGDIAGALASFREKLQLDERYLADDPVNAQARGDVAFSCTRIGELLATQGDFPGALGYERKALGLYTNLAADSPQDLRTRYQTSVVASLTAELKAKLGHRDEALAGCADALALLKELPPEPATAIYTGLRGQVYLHLGAAQAELAASQSLDSSQQQKHWRSARDLYQRSLDIWRDMQKREILTADLAMKPEETARGVAKCEAALRR